MKQADLIIMGMPNYYSMMNALSHALLERCFSFRHTGVFELENKKTILFSTGYSTDISTNPVLNSAKAFINHNKMELVHQFALSGFSQCFTCPEGIGCTVGNIYKKYGNIKELSPDLIPPKFNDNPHSVEEVEKACRIIKDSATLG